jgi:superfamily II DNA or RNA helicase
MGQAKYDAQNSVLDKTYGALADLRRELSDSRSSIAERTELLKSFANCDDSQRAWLLLEDYFGKLSLTRKDFAGTEWWPKLLAARGQGRLEALALLFLRARRPLPGELLPSANMDRLAQIDRAEQEQRFIGELEQWLFPPAPNHLDVPRAALRVLCSVEPSPDLPCLNELVVRFSLFRPRTGEKIKSAAELADLVTRSAHEQELFPQSDWTFIQWLADRQPHERLHPAVQPEAPALRLAGIDLLQWLARWGGTQRLELVPDSHALEFHGNIADLKPDLVENSDELAFTHRVVLSTGEVLPLDTPLFFTGTPALLLSKHTVYLLRNAPPSTLLNQWIEERHVPVKKLSHRFLAQLRHFQGPNGTDWSRVCISHPAIPQFVFELAENTVRLHLMARSDRDQSLWQWNGLEWQIASSEYRAQEKPEFLDDARLDPAVKWLRRLDWFTPEPGLWTGDAHEWFLNSLAAAWPERPAAAEYLGNPAFQRLFLTPHKLRPRLMLQGSGIDWFTVSTEWEREGMKLTQADLERLATSTSRFVELPDGGWVELDLEAVLAAHETMADLGIDGLSPLDQKVDMIHGAHLDERTLGKFANPVEVDKLKKQLAHFSGVEPVPLPASVHADLRPYQKEGFDFLCHLSRLNLGGVLADDMGLGKTLQTLVWLCWHKHRPGASQKPSLVICPASVLHNWRREANRFAPDLKVLVLQSGPARHNLRQQIPQHDVIVTNYAILRRDLTALQKFAFRAIILDEAQFIKNPSAQVTQSVKQLRGDYRLALTGTPLENRILDLWSIMDFVQPGYLGSQTDFNQKYDTPGASEEEIRINRRRLSARLRPLLLRRLKKQVAQDLPDRIEERRDCELGEEQRKLYLSELRRSRDQIMNTVAEKGLAQSKMHVLAALTRLRQICCHPQLVGNDSLSGKTETLFELLEPLLSEGHKVLIFSQFVQMLNLLEQECNTRHIPTHILTGATKQRQEVVQAFQADTQACVFLLSLRAAGTGLNLTSASYVVLYDPWWNPAVEAQAIDRSHRIGQTQKVIAYRLIAPGTVEEKIWELQHRKSQAIADVLGEEGFARSLSRQDLTYLFSEEE